MFSKELLELDQYLANNVVGDDQQVAQIYHKKMRGLLKDYFEKISFAQICTLCRFSLLDGTCCELDIKFSKEAEDKSKAFFDSAAISSLLWNDRKVVTTAYKFCVDRSLSKDTKALIYGSMSKVNVERAPKMGSPLPKQIQATAQKAMPVSEASALLSGRDSLKDAPSTGCCTIV
ncbi:MAG: hypothetical protein K0Q57_481 [Gammaproteobacteria bacterium]|nr:hypothetical protein [Gammaproteobacteria bacterium]